MEMKLTLKFPFLKYKVINTSFTFIYVLVRLSQKSSLDIHFLTNQINIPFGIN